MSEGARRRVPWARILAEFVAIFAGITLSLLADDWRQGREDRAEERSLLLGLMADLRADSAEQAAVFRFAQRHTRGAVWLRLRLEHGPQIPEDSLQFRLGDVTFSTSYDAVSATYVALKDGGRMSVVENDELRDRIISYYERTQSGGVTLHQTIQDEILTWRATFFDYFEVPVTDTTTSFTLSRFRPVRPWADFARNPDVRRQIVMIGISGGQESRIFERLLAANTELVAEIDTYLAAW